MKCSYPLSIVKVHAQTTLFGEQRWSQGKRGKNRMGTRAGYMVEADLTNPAVDNLIRPLVPDAFPPINPFSRNRDQISSEKLFVVKPQ